MPSLLLPGKRIIGCSLAILLGGMSDTPAWAAGQFGTGFVSEPDQVYQGFPKVQRYRAYLPQSVDLSIRFPVPGNQGQQGSCTAWATAYAVRSYYARGNQLWQNYAPTEQVLSPAYVFNQLQSGGQCAMGTTISAALDLLRDSGVPPMSSFPYLADACTLQPGAPIQAMASRFKIRSWRSITPDRLDDVKGQLTTGNPVIFGMDITADFLTLPGSQIYDNVSSPKTDSHAMVLVGYDEARQAFRVFNSWGTDWADGGYAWISYRAMKARAQRFFVVEVPDTVPGTEPLPRPVSLSEKVAPAPVKPVQVVPIVVEAETKTQEAKDKKPAPVAEVVPSPTPLPSPVKPVVAPGKLSLAELRSAAQKSVTDVPCSRLDANITADRSIQVSGFAGAAQDIEQLASHLQALPGVGKVSLDKVALATWPRCEVLLNFEQPLANGRGLTARLVNDHGGQYKSGESLAVEVTTPDFASYLYVTYLNASGEAVHLEWAPGVTAKAIAPGSKVMLGNGLKGKHFRVGPPFGEETIVVVASASPLFTDAIPERAIDREYLTSFRKAFLVRPKDARGSRVVSAAVVPVRTVPD